MNKSPVFIHSLFRSGSTYFFSVFRRSPAGYRCFQEALHPAVYFNKDRPQELLKFHTSTYEIMRHPNLDKPVFYEVVSVSSVWKEKITHSALFDGYFGSDEADNGVEFFQAIIDEVEDGRPVFQECRTAGRIGLLRENLGGFHIYLWRNPWDQWWSYKTTEHLDYQNRQIINAPNTLNSIARLRSHLSFQDPYTDTIPTMQDGVFTAEESYLAYYLLWCLGLYESVKHAHLLINIDRLTESEAYREEILSRLSENGIAQIDFSDCQIPQGNYYDEDIRFFSPLEEKVHGWLMEDLSVDQVNRIQELRMQYQPQNLGKIKKDDQLNSFARQITQVRAVSRRFETNKALYLKQYLTIKKELETRIDQEKNKVIEFEKDNNKALEALTAVYNSHSWRITRPLRWLGRQVRLLQMWYLKITS